LFEQSNSPKRPLLKLAKGHRLKSLELNGTNITSLEPIKSLKVTITGASKKLLATMN
jgi:hypothetical protein